MLSDNDGSNENKSHLPNFLWLLRDVDSIPVDAKGTRIPPTQFLRRTLKNMRSSLASSTLLHHFPSLHCIAIPPPSSDPEVLSEIMSNHNNLSPLFNESVEEASQYIIKNVETKRGYSSGVLDGHVLACLIEQYFHLLSDTGHKIPTFQVSWFNAVELRLKKLATSLLDEYDEEMKEQLKGKYPMVDGQRGERGDTLINIHLQVFAKIRLKLQKEIFSFQRSSDETTCIEKEIISRFDRDIVEYDKRNQVINGRLYKYICENHRASEEYCSSLYREKYENIVYTKLHNALHSQIPTDIDQELSTLSREYFENVSGPASSEVYSTLRAESSVLEADLRLIPGPIQSLVVIGLDSDRVKLRWTLPMINPSSVENYSIVIKSKGKDWEVISERKRCSVLVTGLESRKWYCLGVIAISRKFRGKCFSLIRFRTLFSSSAKKAIVIGGTIAAPIVYPAITVYLGMKLIKRGNPHQKALGGVALAIAPLQMIPGLSTFYSGRYCHLMVKTKGDVSDHDTDTLSYNREASSELEEVGNGEVDVPSDSEGEDHPFAPQVELLDLSESEDED